MPTGYTADVQEGKVTSFREFAIQCARAFGATISMREEPLDAPIPDEFKPGDYYVTSVQQAEIKLGRLLQMTDDEAAAEARKEHEERVKYAADYRTKKAAQRQRYEAMMAKAEAWMPPSTEHDGMKKFMLDQLRDSLKFDCGSDYSPTVEPLLSGPDWKLQQIARATEELERSRASLREEEDRVRKRNQWIRLLRESLKGCE